MGVLFCFVVRSIGPTRLGSIAVPFVDKVSQTGIDHVRCDRISCAIGPELS